jgi:hypothetical protein
MRLWQTTLKESVERLFFEVQLKTMVVVHGGNSNVQIDSGKASRFGLLPADKNEEEGPTHTDLLESVTAEVRPST